MQETLQISVVANRHELIKLLVKEFQVIRGRLLMELNETVPVCDWGQYFWTILHDILGFVLHKAEIRKKQTLIYKVWPKSIKT